MKKSRLALIILVLVAILSTGLIFVKALLAEPVQADRASKIDISLASQPGAAPRAVPVAALPLFFQLLVGLVGAFFVLLGVLPIFLIDSDNRAG